MPFRAIMQAGVAGVAWWPHDEEANHLGKERMVRERIIKEDGRYLIYYRFVEDRERVGNQEIREAGNQEMGEPPASLPPEVRHV
jgi:hypothetical protein